MYRKALYKIKFTRFSECMYVFDKCVITGERKRNRPRVIKMSEREFNNASTGSGSVKLIYLSV